MESAAERKARLKALRAAAEESGLVSTHDAGDECAPGPRRAAHAAAPRLTARTRRPPLKFRNYVPRDEALREAKARGGWARRRTR